MELFFIRVWEPLSSPGSDCSTNPSPTTKSQWGWGFHAVQTGIDARVSAIVPRVCWGRRRLESFMLQILDPILRGWRLFKLTLYGWKNPRSRLTF